METRMSKYNRKYLVNDVLRDIEKDSYTFEDVKAQGNLTTGYPAWNLMYYNIICSLPEDRNHANVIETGTCKGLSTIVLAQALKDRGFTGAVDTVELSNANYKESLKNIKDSGLSDFITSTNGDSLEFLANYVKEKQYIDFAFLDGNHSYEYCVKEFEIIFPLISKVDGKVYFDNVKYKPITDALAFIKSNYGGNVVKYFNCSWGPSGQAIWSA